MKRKPAHWARRAKLDGPSRHIANLGFIDAGPCWQQSWHPSQIHRLCIVCFQLIRMNHVVFVASGCHGWLDRRSPKGKTDAPWTIHLTKRDSEI